jgi:hypothetical protein
MKNFPFGERRLRPFWGAVREQVRRFAFPPGLDSTARHNYRNIQIDAVAIGLSNAGTPFLPVFLARLGAGAFEIGMLTAMPAFAGLVFALAIGRFLSGRRSVVPWFSLSRLLYLSAYAATGIAPFLVPRESLIPVLIGIWAAATLPQTMLNVTFSVVMNAVAGPEGRYRLLSRRWTILGFTTALAVIAIGALLDRTPFPVNYQAAFLMLSAAGLVSFYFSSRIILPEREPQVAARRTPWRETLAEYGRLIRGRPEFLSFSLKRFVYYAGFALSQPILPLYYVHAVQASDAWIGAISMVSTVVVLFGYPFWARQSRVRSPRFVLLATTLGAGLYPLLVAATRSAEVIIVLAGISGVFQAGVNLVFFDEIMKRIPEDQSAMFVSFAQMFQYLATAAAPLLATLLTEWIGLGGALAASSALCLVSAALFAMRDGRAE